MDLMILTNKN